MRILIVEDEPDIQKLIQLYLQPYVSDCDLAQDGAEAVEKFTASLGNGKKYAAVLLDVLLPQLNGQEVLTRIRYLEKVAGVSAMDGVKIIMLTALDDTSSVIQSFKRHCDSYIVKPFEPEKLIKELRDFGLIPEKPAA